jgi:hypothetical protein
VAELARLSDFLTEVSEYCWSRRLELHWMRALVHGRYAFTPPAGEGLRPLRDPAEPAEDE